jgi:hypothetical protein
MEKTVGAVALQAPEQVCHPESFCTPEMVLALAGKPEPGVGEGEAAGVGLGAADGSVGTAAFKPG